MPTKQIDLTDQLRAAVRDSGLTQSALAEQTGLRQPHLSAWLSGARDLQGKSLDKIARALGKNLA